MGGRKKNYYFAVFFLLTAFTPLIASTQTPCKEINRRCHDAALASIKAELKRMVADILVVEWGTNLALERRPVDIASVQAARTRARDRSGNQPALHDFKMKLAYWGWGYGSAQAMVLQHHKLELCNCSPLMRRFDSGLAG